MQSQRISYKFSVSNYLNITFAMSSWSCRKNLSPRVYCKQFFSIFSKWKNPRVRDNGVNTTIFFIENEQKKNNGKQGEDEEKRKNDWNFRNRMVEKFTRVYINAEHFLLP